MKNKKESLSVSLSKLIMAVSIIVSGGALIGAIGYLVSQPQQIIIPFINSPAKKEITITTDKPEYAQGEEIKINIKNNGKNETFLTFPAIEVFEPIDKNLGGGEWRTIRTIWAGCGVTGGLLYLPLSAEELYTYSWDQKEKWCTGGNPWDTAMSFQEVRSGKYRVKTALVQRTKSTEEDPNNISGRPTNNFIYSNEFTIKEKTVANQDICDIGKGDWGNGNAIFTTANEGDAPLTVAKQKCEEKNECMWKVLGGKATDNYACCPKDLNSIITDENRKLYERCFIIID